MATIAMGGETREISVGRVFARGLDVIRRNPVATLGTTFLLALLPSLLIQQAAVGMSVMNDVRRGLYLYAGIGGLILLLLSAAANGAVIQATVAHDEGRKADLGEVLRVGLLRSVPLVAVIILYWIGLSFGMALLIVPGIILGVMWSMALPAVVAERTGIFGAFARSRHLTKGARWKVFGILLLALAIYVIVLMALTFVSAAGYGSLAAFTAARASQPPSFLAQLASALVTTVTITWLTATGASLFVELRQWKDGPDTARLSEIFA